MDKELIKVAFKSPITYALIIVASILTFFVSAYSNRSDDNLRAANAQIEWRNTRIENLEKLLDDYTRVVLYKDAQIKSRDFILDSLKNEK